MESKDKPTASPTSWQQIIPNVLTIVRIVLVPVFIVLMILYHLHASTVLLAFSLLVFMVAAYTDHLDGKLARRWQVVSNFGKLLDPIADKALMISAFVLLSLFQNLWWWFTAVVILRELAVTGLRMYLLRSGEVLPASKGGKIKTSLQILMVFLWMLAGICYPLHAQLGIFIMYLAIAALIAAFVATVLSGMVYFLDAHDNQKKQAEHPETESKSEDKPAHSSDKQPGDKNKESLKSQEKATDSTAGDCNSSKDLPTKGDKPLSDSSRDLVKNSVSKGEDEAKLDTKEKGEEKDSSPSSELESAENTSHKAAFPSRRQRRAKQKASGTDQAGLERGDSEQVTGIDSPKVEASSIPHSRFDVPDLSQNSAQAAKNHGSIEIEESSSESEKLADKPGKTGSDESETKNRSTETDREETAKEAKSRFALSRSQMRRNHKKK